LPWGDAGGGRAVCCYDTGVPIYKRGLCPRINQINIAGKKKMAKFLNTSGTTYYLEELIKNAQERLYLISPYLKLNDRVKELLEDKDRIKSMCGL